MLPDLDRRLRESCSDNSDAPSKIEEQQSKKENICTRLLKIYPKSVLAAIIIQQFNSGLKSMFGLAMSALFKNTYNLEPTETASYTLAINGPFYLKVVFGLFIDALSKWISKPNYFVVMGLLQFVSLMVVSFANFDDVRIAVAVLGIASFSGAFADVTVQAIVVEAARVDPKSGAQDLQSLSWIIFGVGITIGSIVAAYATEYFTPAYVFVFYAIIGLASTTTGCMINDKLLQKNKANQDDMSLW